MEIVTLCLVLTFIFLISIRSLMHHRRSMNLPPGPKPYPIIGNILDIGKAYHRSFHKLSKIYGPIITLYLGSRLVVVVSSPEIAKEVIKSHERVFTTMFLPIASKAHDHNKYSIVFRPTDNHWRKLRKICKEHMLSAQCLNQSQNLRQEMIRRLCDYVNKCSVEGRVLDMGEASFITALNLITATIFSTAETDYESGAAQEFREIVEGVINSFSANNIADVFPILRPFDPQGVKKRAELDFGKLLSTFDGFINRRLEARKEAGDAKKYNDMLEALLHVMETSDGEFTRRDIRHLFLELYLAATSTTSAAFEWTMAELLRNPNVMSKVQDEVRAVVGTNEQVRESDTSKLPYLNAVIKETLRYHPPGALFGRALEQDIQVNGYVIPRSSEILFNVFTINRDPNAWSDPDKFYPERFMGTAKNIDFKGQDFEFLPFGAGRKMCAGMPLADRIMHHMVAALVHKFDWKLEPGMKPKDLDMKEKPSISLKKNVPLMAIPVKPPTNT